MNNRKRKLFLSVLTVLFVFTLLSFTAGAADNPTFGTFKKNIMWSFDTETKVLTISGKGEMADAGFANYPWYKYCRLDTEKLIIEEGITHIGEYAFDLMSNLKEVKLPESLNTIGKQAFGSTDIEEFSFPEGMTVIPEKVLNYCHSLKRIYIPESVEIIGAEAFRQTGVSDVILPEGLREIGGRAFSGCSGIKNIHFDDKLEKIGTGAFSYCSGLESVTVPDNVTVLGGSAFQECKNLKSIRLSENIEAIGTYTFQDCVSLTEAELPESVKIIGGSAFDGCTALKKVKVNGDINTVDWFAFLNCTALEEINLPDTVTAVGRAAFQNCINIREINLGEGLEMLSDETFYGCTSLEMVNIPSTLKTIGKHAFYKCSSLKEANVPSGVTSIGTYAFAYCSALTELNFPDGEDVEFNIIGCSSLKSVRIPSNVKRLSLHGCSSLETVEIPATVTSIAANGFVNCSSLKEIIIPDTVTEVESVIGLFSGCTSLKRVVLPQCVETIGKNMFADCTSLKEITVSSKITAIGEKAFYNCSSLEKIPIFEDTDMVHSSSFAGTKWYESQPEGFVFLGKTIVGYKGEIPENTALIIPDGTKRIAGNVFSGNSNIISVEIPESVIAIEQRAFYGCTNLSVIRVPNTALRIGNEAFHETAWYNGQTANWIYIGKVLYKYRWHKRDDVTIKINSSVKAIADYAFYDISSFWFEAVIPVNVEYIGRSAFYQPDAMVVDVTVQNVNCVFGSNFSIRGDTAHMTFINSYGLNNNVHNFCKKYSYDYTNLTCKHSYVTKSVIKKAGCTENGEYLEACRYCGVERTYKKSPTGHSFVTAETVNPTCTEPGYMRNVCSLCGELEVIMVTAKGHRNVRKVISPTCEKDGYTAEMCGVCGLENRYNITEATGHAYESVTVPATQEKDGYSATVCTLCGKEDSVTITQVKSVYLSTAEYVYDGSRTAPDISVKDADGQLLEDGTDYVVKYADNREPGIGTASVVFKGNYSGIRKLTYRIIPENVGKIKATATHNTLKLTWPEVTGAAGYYIYTYNSKSEKYTKVAAVTETTHTFRKLKPGKKYTYYIKAYKVSGEETLLSEDYTKISAVTALSAPKNLKATAGKKKVTLSWKKVTSAAGYEIVYSASKSFKNSKKATLSKGSTVKKTVKKLKSGKKYYFKVRAFKTVDGKKAYGAWSTVKSVKVK